MLFCSSQIDEARRKVTITLNDCLACSGCVTSAETVLITQQSQHELYRVLSDIKKAEVVLVNLPVGAVAEYCDEYVCLSVCVCVCVCLSVREDISRTTCAIFTKFFVHVAYYHGSVLLRHFDDGPHRLSAGRGWQECTVWVRCNLWLPCVKWCVCLLLHQLVVLPLPPLTYLLMWHFFIFFLPASVQLLSVLCLFWLGSLRPFGL